ncbi:MAG: hypothetical protein WD058_06215 [Dehalococcoidia bacterium]
MIGHADGTGAVLVTVTPEAVAITITGGEVAFGGPYSSGASVRAHPQPSVQNASPPTVSNTGNVAVTYLDVSFVGPSGEEATCDGGEGAWAAHASSPAPDRFTMKAWASTNTALGTFNDNAEAVMPGVGTGNILSVESLAPAEAMPLLLELRMPSPAVVGGEGCSIGLAVTAAAIPE